MCPRTSFRGANEGVASAAVAHKEIELPGVSHQPPCQPFSVALCELADDGACLVPAVGQPDVSLFLEGDDRLPDFERLQQSRLSEKGKELGRSPTATCGVCKMPSVPGRDNRVANFHSWTSANPVPMSFGRGPLIARWAGCPNL